MNPLENSRENESCSDSLPNVSDSETRCSLIPWLPTAVRTRASNPSGGAVMMLITPAVASDPYMLEPEPRSTSTRVTESTGTGISMS
jgi:hypothetical protein